MFRDASESAADRARQAEVAVELRPARHLLLGRGRLGGEDFGQAGDLLPGLAPEQQGERRDGRDVLDLRVPLAALEDGPAPEAGVLGGIDRAGFHPGERQLGGHSACARKKKASAT